MIKRVVWYGQASSENSTFLETFSYSLFFFYQGGRNISLARNEQNALKPSGDHLLVPLLPDHDYVLLESDTIGIVYYDEEPECLEYFNFLTAIKKPEVITNSYS